MLPTTVNTMTSIFNPPSSPPTDISLREFVVDEDAEHFNAALWRTIDQNAFILAQRDALEAFNVAKALRLSEETAAVELERRNAAPVTAPLSTLQSSRHKKIGATLHPQYSTPSDEAISRSLPRSSHTQVDISQENRSSPSSSALPIKSIKTAQQSSSYHPQDKKAPASIANQNSGHQLSLSTSSFPPSVDSRHSRSTHNFTKVPSLLLPPVGDHRAFSKRETGITDEPTVSTPSSSQFQVSEATQPKRRRTERKPSVSSPSIDVVVVAPPLSVPQKSSTFSRSLRPGTIIPTTQDTVPASEGAKSFTSTPAPVPKKITVAKQKAHFHNPFNDIQICPQCGNRLTIPRIQVNNSSFPSHLAILLISFSFSFFPFALVRIGFRLFYLARLQLSTPHNSRSLCDALHTTCSSCMTRHCRGCTSISSCTRSCSAGQNLTSCAVRSCCYNVRAVVIFEALSVFDHIFATEAGFASTSTTAGGVDPDPHSSFHSGRRQREAYIKLLISKADKSMRKFEDAFVCTLKVICSWLQYSPEEGFDADDEVSAANPSYLDASIAHLLLASYLPEVIHTFLSNNNVRDWIAHSDTYSMILETLRWISNFPTLSNVLNLPLPPVQRNCSLKQWATGQGFINFLGYPSDAKKSLIMKVEPIGDLIRRLETHRSGLRAFSAKVQFEATLDKVNILCDGISYLLLQQVVGGI